MTVILRLLPLCVFVSIAAPAWGSGFVLWTMQTEEGREVDYTRLAEAAAADAVNLTDEQKAEVSRILAARDEALAGAEEADQSAIREQALTDLGAILTDEQRLLFESLFGNRPISFSFRQQKWDSVLHFIADEAGLSLVMDEAPPGTFNYSDRKEYTPAEAIDLLNGWLVTKGFTLIRRDRLLMCVNLQDGLPEGAIPRVTAAELPLRGRFEFVSLLIPLVGRPAESAEAEISPLLGPHGKATVLPATGQVLVIDTAESVRTIAKIVEQIPVPKTAPPPTPAPKPPTPELHIYPIAHANPEMVGEVLQKMVTGTLLVDAKANQITINAIPAEHDKAKIIIEQLESNQGPDRMPVLELYSVPVSSTEELLATLQLVVPEAQFRLDAASQKLVAWARSSDQLIIADTLQKIDKEQLAGTAQLEVYSAGRSDPEALHTMMTALFPQARINVDAGTGSLVVVGSLEDHRAIRELVDQMQSGKLQPGDRELRSYPISADSADTAVTLLQSITPSAQVTLDTPSKRLLVVATADDQAIVSNALEQMGSSLTEELPVLRSYAMQETTDLDTLTALLATLVPDAKVTSDTTNQRLLITAIESDHAVIVATIEQVERDVGGHLPELRFYPVGENFSDAATGIVQAIVPNASLTLESATGQLMVVATETEHENVATTIEKLAASLPASESRRLKIYDVAATNATQLESLLTGLAEELPGLQVIADANPAEVAVLAADSQHATVTELLAQLEREIPVDRKPTLTVYPIVKVDVTGMSEALTELFPDAKITVDLKASRLLINALPASHKAIKAAIEQLDSDLPEGQEIRLMVYPVRGIDPASAVSLLATELPDLTVIQDTVAQTLIVRGSLNAQEDAAELLEALRLASVPLKERSVVAYPAVFSDATGATAFLTGAFPNARVVFDTDGSRMMVWATGEEHQSIRKAIEDLRAAAETNDASNLVSYPLTGLDTAGLADMLSVAAPDAQVVFADNQMLCWARAAEQTIVARVMEQLRAGHGGTEDEQLRVFPLGDVAAATAQPVLLSAFPDLEVIQSADAANLMAWTDDVTKARIEAMLQQLADSSVTRSLEFYSIRDLGPSATTVIQSSVPAAVITAGAKPDQISVVADDRDHAEIKAVLAQLQAASEPPQKRTLSVHNIHGTDPAAVQAVLAPLVDADVQITVDPTGRRLFVRTFEGRQKFIAETIEQIMASAQPDSELETKSYVVGAPNADEALEVIIALYPDVTAVTDADNKLLVATATAEQHTRIASIAEQIAGSGTIGNAPYPVVYTTNNVPPAEVAELVDELFSRSDDVRVSVNDRSGRLIAIARADQHKTIGKMLEQFDGEPIDEVPMQLKAYRISPLDPETVMDALEPLVATNVTLSAGRRSNEIVVGASPAEQEHVAKLIQQLTDSSPAKGLVTKTYRMLRSEADDAQDALQALFPDATLVTDSTRKVLVATATAEQQTTIEDVVRQMSSLYPGAAGPVARTYPLTLADGDNLVEVFTSLFADVDDVQVTYDSPNRTLVAVALPEQHAQIQELLAELDPAGDGRQGRSAEIYALPDQGGEGIVEIVRGLLNSRDSGGELVHELQTKQLVVTTTADVHVQVAEMISRFLLPDERGFEVFQMRYLDAENARRSIDTMFSSRVPRSQDRPQINSDNNTQQLMVTATPEQMTEIRQLLVKLGEVGLAGPGEDNRNLRVIPIGADPEAALRQLEDLWPKLRDNPLKIMPREDNRRPRFPQEINGGQFSLPPESLADESRQNASPQKQQQDKPPVVIIPGDDRLTIASDDTEALDQMESLLRTLFARSVGGRNLDFSIFQLHNAGAEETSRTLNQIFESGLGFPGFDPIALVGEKRLNAIIVFGGRNERDRVRQLLEILDSDRLADTTRTYRTEVIPVTTADATQISELLQGVYKGELTAGGARPAVDIPSGVDPEIAAVLRQVNAAASSPLLTIEVQSSTNSLIVKAPQSLIMELTALVEQLDEASKFSRARGITLLPLRKTNSSRVMEILGKLLD